MSTGRWFQRLSGELFRIRYRLLLVNALIVAVPLVGISFAHFYEREVLRALEDDMVHQAETLRQALTLDQTGLRLADRKPLVQALARYTRTRIRLLDAQGHLVVDSHENGPPEGPERPPSPYPWSRSSPSPSPSSDLGLTSAPPSLPPSMIDPSGRAEVKKALAGRYGAATRIWEGGHRVFLFGALPISRGGRVEGVVYVTRSTTPVRLAMRRLRTTLFKVLLVALAVTAVLSLFFAWTISRPLSLLTAFAKRIAAGDRDARLAPALSRRRDEIGQLTRAFDAMTRRLDERARYIGELAANISHEFKSPLTSMRGAAELLLDGAADDPAARARFLENILADAHRLDRLVTRLLELSRVEADPAPSEIFDYEELVRETAARRGEGPGVVVEFRAARTQLRGRRAHLASVLGNLLDNARQHAAGDKPITVHVADGAGGGLRTSVHNHNGGAPISEANLGMIWERFFTTRASDGGTGLGLPIVQAVVTAHGGTVAVTSSAEEGTTFSFDLPQGG